MNYEDVAYDIVYMVIITQITLLALYQLWLYKSKNDTASVDSELKLINELLGLKKHDKIVTLKDVEEEEKKAGKVVVFSENIYRDIKNDGSFPIGTPGLETYADTVSRNLKDGKKYQYFLKNDTHSRHIYKTYLNTHQEAIDSNKELAEFVFIPSNLFSFYSEVNLYLMPSEKFITIEGYFSNNIRLEEQEQKLLNYLKKETNEEETNEEESIFISSGDKWIAKFSTASVDAKIIKLLQAEKANKETIDLKRFDCNSCKKYAEENHLCFERHFESDNNKITGMFRGNMKKLESLSEIASNLTNENYGRYSFEYVDKVDKIVLVDGTNSEGTTFDTCNEFNHSIEDICITSIGKFEYKAYEFLPAVSDEATDKEEANLFYLELEPEQVSKLVIIRNNLLRVHKSESDEKIHKLKKEFN